LVTNNSADCGGLINIIIISWVRRDLNLGMDFDKDLNLRTPMEIK